MFHSAKSTAMSKRDTGYRGDKDENIPEIGNDGGEVPEPPHHYWVAARTLLVFANRKVCLKKNGQGRVML